MNKKLKKFITYFITSILVFCAIATFYLYIPKTLESFDNRLRDYMFIIRGDVPNSDNIVIIDLDDKSLKQVGQWPWSREYLSTLLINLTNSGIGLIAFDVVFPEEDRTNPTKILNKLNIKTDIEIPDYDKIFGEIISQTPTILGYQFQLAKDDFIEKRAPDIPAIFIEKNRTEQNKNMVIKAHGTILNIPVIQQHSYSSGFLIMYQMNQEL